MAVGCLLERDNTMAEPQQCDSGGLDELDNCYGPDSPPSLHPHSLAPWWTLDALGAGDMETEWFQSAVEVLVVRSWTHVAVRLFGIRYATVAHHSLYGYRPDASLIARKGPSRTAIRSA